MDTGEKRSEQLRVNFMRAHNNSRRVAISIPWATSAVLMEAEGAAWWHNCGARHSNAAGECVRAPTDASLHGDR